jgi:hypothetical protein
MEFRELNLAIHTGAREFALMTSGHGFPYRFEGDNPYKPTLPLVSIMEAHREAVHFLDISDFIGGRAKVYHAPTKLLLGMKQLYKLQADNFQPRPEDFS